jgi:hypothetical protein
MRPYAILVAAILCACSSASTSPSVAPQLPATAVQRLTPNAIHRVSIKIYNYYFYPSVATFHQGDRLCVTVNPTEGSIAEGKSETVTLTIDEECERLDGAYGKLVLELAEPDHHAFWGEIILDQRIGTKETFMWLDTVFDRWDSVRLIPCIWWTVGKGFDLDRDNLWLEMQPGYPCAG